MGFESQKNSSSSAATTNQTTSKPITLQDVEGATFAGNDISAGSGTVNITDGGAVAGMVDVTMGFLDAQNKAQGQVLTFAENASKQAIDFAFGAGAPDSANTKWVLLTVAAVAGIWLVVTKGKF